MRGPVCGLEPVPAGVHRLWLWAVLSLHLPHSQLACSPAAPSTRPLPATLLVQWLPSAGPLWGWAAAGWRLSSTSCFSMNPALTSLRTGGREGSPAMLPALPAEVADKAVDGG